MSVSFPVNERLLSRRLGALGSVRGWAPNVLPELERFIRTSDDYDLFRVNPIRYGGAAGLSDAAAIELFVHAANVGLFEMDRLLICAYCPQVAGSFRELDQVHPRFQWSKDGSLSPNNHSSAAIKAYASIAGVGFCVPCDRDRLMGEIYVAPGTNS